MMLLSAMGPKRGSPRRVPAQGGGEAHRFDHHGEHPGTRTQPQQPDARDKLRRAEQRVQDWQTNLDEVRYGLHDLPDDVDVGALFQENPAASMPMIVSARMPSMHSSQPTRVTARARRVGAIASITGRGSPGCLLIDAAIPGS